MTPARTSLASAMLAIVVAALAGCGDARSLPPPSTDRAAAERQKDAFVEAMKPRRPGKPVVAVVALNEGTEITDLLLPHAVLERSGVADVQVVAPRRGRVVLYPALEVDGAQDFGSFDQAHPTGADYVIVPAMHDDDVPAITDWLKRQAKLGARILGVCAGALVVGNAGLLDGRRFATHWYWLERALERSPSAVYVPHQRYVVDRGVATTTGVTASVPAILALVESIGGRERAGALAAELGVDSWTPVHDSSSFGLDAGRRFDYVLNALAFWRDEHWSVPVHDGMDDVVLASTVDAWSRTGHIGVVATAAKPVRLRSGLVLATTPGDPDAPRLPLAAALTPVRQLDQTLCEIESRFGERRREWVAMELEYPGFTEPCPR